MDFALLMMTVQMTQPINNKPVPTIAKRVEIKKVYVLFGIPLRRGVNVDRAYEDCSAHVNMANAAQMVPRRRK